MVTISVFTRCLGVSLGWEPDLLEVGGNKCLPSLPCFVLGFMCNTNRYQFYLTHLWSFKEQLEVHVLRPPCWSLSVHCSSLSSCLNTAEFLRGAKKTWQCCQVDRKPCKRKRASQPTQEWGWAQPHPISWAHCCYVHPTLPLWEACTGKCCAPLCSRAFHRCRHLDSSVADSVATDSQRLPVWFSVGTKGSEDKVCNELFSVALLSNVQFWVVVDCKAGLCGFLINRSRDVIGLWESWDIGTCPLLLIACFLWTALPEGLLKC